MLIPSLVKSIGKRAGPSRAASMRVPPLRLIEHAIAHLRAQAGRDRALPISLLIVNVDRFKLVNDLCGHAAGDRLIEHIRDRCARSSRSLQVIHIGADEFACLLPVTAFDSGEGDRIADRIAERLLEAVGDPVSLGRHIVHPTASVGIATDRFGTLSPEELLRGASIALSHAKQAGGGTVQRFCPAMFADLSDRATLEDDLRGGLLRGELLPYYQPIVSLGSRKIARFEALVRWHHPHRGLLGPDQFLTIAEEAGLDDDLLFSMVRQACRDAGEWEGLLGLSINMTPRQVCDPTVALRLLRIVFASGMRPDRFTVEITEDAMMHNVVAAQETVATLREAGIRIALDDFGTGYTSLSRICQLPLDMIKIDRSLIQSLDTDAGRKLVKVVVDLGQSLSMPVTAEGIETPRQARLLNEIGCTFGQGYLFGRAAPASLAARLAGAAPLAIAS